MTSKKTRPLVSVGTNPRAEIYRAKYVPYAATRYLDFKALKKTPRVVIELGQIAAAGRKIAVVGEIRKGMVTRMRPMACQDCREKGSTPHRQRKFSSATKKLLRDAIVIAAKGSTIRKFPLPVEETARSIEIGPIIIFNGPKGLDACITIEQNTGGFCVYCLFGSTWCVGDIVIGK